MRNLTVNGERLWASLMELAQIGATQKGGVCRLAASDLDAEARRLFIDWCEEAGCTVTIDRIGNIFARRPGRRAKMLPMRSILTVQPAASHQRMKTRRASASRSLAASRHTPPFAVAPIRASSIRLAHSRSPLTVRLRISCHPISRKFASAASTARIVAASRWPIIPPILLRDTVVALSTMICERLLKPFSAVGSTGMRNNGQSRKSLVSGTRVIDGSSANALL